MAFDYAKAYQQFIDEELAAASATAWMIPQAGKVRFTGGRDIEISTLSTTGLGDYDATKADRLRPPPGHRDQQLEELHAVHGPRREVLPGPH